MCGICGYRSDNKIPLDKMASILAHRGPDGFGVFYHNDIGLGHRRLSIIDTARGNQPMYSSNNNLVVVYNGEIYNFKELKNRLSSQGYTFYTDSDTEVLLTMYAAYGTSMLQYLNGMFAFVIYDKTEDILFGARDRIGIKPLYYAYNGRDFIFASEIKSILESRVIKPAGNPAAADLYFTYRYIPGQNTIFKNINKVLPANAFIQKGKKPPQFWKYWELSRNEANITFDSACDQFNSLLTESVKYQLISDVPLGAFLSGGVDSTVIVSKMAELNQNPIRTFTAGFNSCYDETQEAKRTADYFKCENHTITVNPQNMQLLEKIVWHMDEPFGDQILIPLYLLSSNASKHVKVILTGEGADEGQMGYIHHESISKIMKLSKFVPSFMLPGLSILSKYIPVSLLDIFFNYPGSMGVYGRNRVSSLLSNIKNPAKTYLLFASLFQEEERKTLYGPVLQKGLIESKEEFTKPFIEKINSSKNPLREIYFHDIANWLPDNILNKLDRILMANSIEGRVPYLDHRLIEFEASLPENIIIKNGKGKHLLRTLFKQQYNIPGRKTNKKQPFYMPLDGQLNSAFKDLIGTYLSFDKIDSSLLNPSAVKKIVQDAEKSPLAGHKQIMSLIMFQIWMDIFKPEWN